MKTSSWLILAAIVAGALWYFWPSLVKLRERALGQVGQVNAQPDNLVIVLADTGQLPDEEEDEETPPPAAPRREVPSRPLN